MAQWFGFDEVKEIEIFNTGFLIWPAGSHYRLDGKGISVIKDLTLDIDTVGMGGIDVLPIQTNATYNVFSVYLPNGTVEIIGSLSESISGYPFRKIGTFNTDGSGLVSAISPETDTIYFGNPENDGSFKIFRENNSLKIQKKETGNWVTKDTIE